MKKKFFSLLNFLNILFLDKFFIGYFLFLCVRGMGLRVEEEINKIG